MEWDNGSGIDLIGNTRYRLELEQANVIKLYSNRSVIRSHSNPNNSMRFLIMH